MVMTQLIECPRDAMQGLPNFIPTAQKVQYLNLLLRVGFHTLDFGSFVSAKAIPQMRDSAEVVQQLSWQTSNTRLLAIVANERGAKDALAHEPIYYLGFPLSVSETFQKRNTNQSIDEALRLTERIQRLCLEHSRELVVYISMGFGNPYGDPYSPEHVSKLIGYLYDMGVGIVSLADTVGSATVETIEAVYKQATQLYPCITFGVHLHARAHEVSKKVAAAYRAGCRRFDGALRGFGGCPMAKDDLVGNLDTEILIDTLQQVGAQLPGLDKEALEEAKAYSFRIFS